MGSMSALIYLTSIVVALLHAASAQSSPQDFLTPHNAARAQVRVPPMMWDETVAAYARNSAAQRAADCNLVHSTGGPYGENIAKSDGALTAAGAVGLWVGEKPFYNYNSNSCAGGDCDHYTQVVWRNSVRLGCASVRCRDGGTFITCNYGPRGNIIGQRPY